MLHLKQQQQKLNICKYLKGSSEINEWLWSTQTEQMSENQQYITSNSIIPRQFVTIFSDTVNKMLNYGTGKFRFLLGGWDQNLMPIMSFSKLFIMTASVIKRCNIRLRWGQTCRSSVPRGTVCREWSEICRRRWRSWRRNREPRSTGQTGSVTKWRAWLSQGQWARLRSTWTLWRWASKDSFNFNFNCTNA